MNQSFDVSTIVFAALAVFIVWKLRSVLGTRTGEERPPFNPFVRRNRTDAGAPVQPGSDGGNVVSLPGAAPAPRAAVDPDRWKGLVEPGSAAVAGLDQIAAADPSFSGRQFADGARAAYEMIIAAFAKGERSVLERLLAKDVFDGFAAAIAEREARGETVRNTFVSIDKAVAESAQLRGGSAQVTMRFESQQINQVLTAAGAPAEGGSEGVSPVIDRWTFARDVASADPNWKLISTQAE